MWEHTMVQARWVPVESKDLARKGPGWRVGPLDFPKPGVLGPKFASDPRADGEGVLIGWPEIFGHYSDQGWELVAVIRDDTDWAGLKLFFKRPKP